MPKQKSKKNYSLILVLAVMMIMGFNSYVNASSRAPTPSTKTSTVNITQAVAQSYNADSSVDLGMIVGLKPGSSDTVQALPQNMIQDMLGVAVEANQATIALTPANVTKQLVFVATNGRYNVLVSDQNGSIKSGDYITVSALAGVGMKADQGQQQVLGTAAASFDGTGNVVSTANVTNTLGKSANITIGLIPVNIGVTHNPLYNRQTDYIPAFISKAATSIAAKPVSAAKVYLGLVVLVLSGFLTANVLYSGIKGGMLAVGRNPLSRKSIIKSLIQTVMAGMIVFVTGLFGVYLLLKL